MQMKCLTLLTCAVLTKPVNACVDDNSVFYDLLLSQSPGKTCMEVIADAHKSHEIDQLAIERRELSEIETKRKYLLDQKSQLKDSQCALKERAYKGDLVTGQYCNIKGKKGCVKLPVYIGMQFDIDTVNSQLDLLRNREREINRAYFDRETAKKDAQRDYEKYLKSLETTWSSK